MPPHNVKFDRPFSNAVLCSAAEVAALDATSTQNSAAAASTLAAHEAIEKILIGIAQQVQTLQSQHQINLDQVTTTSVQLAGIIVKKLLSNSDVIKADRLEQLIKEALNRPEPVASIRLHPEDHSKLSSFIENISVQGQSLNVAADESVGAGECRVDYPGFELASNLAQQIEDIEHRLMEAINDE